MAARIATIVAPPRGAHDQQRARIGEPDDEHEHRDAGQPPGDARFGGRDVGAGDGGETNAPPERGARLRFGSLGRDARRQPDDDGEDVAERVAIPAGRIAHRGCERDPQIDGSRRMPAESGGHDASDRILDPAHEQPLADDVATAAEGRAPERVTQHRRRCGPTLIVGGVNARSKPWPDAEHVEVPPGDQHRVGAPLFALDDHARRIALKGSRAGKGRDLIADRRVGDVRRRRHAAAAGIVARLKAQGEHTPGVGDERRRAEQGAIDQTEHGEVHSGRDGERRDRCQRGPGRGEEGADGGQGFETRAFNHDAD